MTDNAFGKLLRGMLGRPDPQPGPPYTHTLTHPETEEETAAEPALPAFTVERTRGRHYENGPLEVPAPFRRLRAADALPLSTANPGSYFTVERDPAETPAAFQARLTELVGRGDITVNTARRALGFPAWPPDPPAS